LLQGLFLEVAFSSKGEWNKLKINVCIFLWSWNISFEKNVKMLLHFFVKKKIFGYFLKKKKNYDHRQRNSAAYLPIDYA